MKKLFVSAVAAVGIMAGTVVSANAYVGAWYYHDVTGDWEVLRLGDNSDGTYRELRGTGLYCGRPGQPYARIRRVLDRNAGNDIRWWETHSCDNTVRICVENYRGETACSTYWDNGWR